MSLVYRGTRNSAMSRRPSLHKLSQRCLYAGESSASNQSHRKPNNSDRGYPHSLKLVGRVHHEGYEGLQATNISFNAGSNVGGSENRFKFLRNPLTNAAAIVVGLGTLFLGGIAYVQWYNKNVLDKIELAFEAGYSNPTLEIAFNIYEKRDRDESGVGSEVEPPWTQHLRRREQDLIDRIVQGEESGYYYVLLGPKGSGKGIMIFYSMMTIDTDGVVLCNAHPDLEVFRLRLGKALNYEFNEDLQTGFFHRRDPRKAGPSLDIERALNTLEKVALRRAKKRGKPSVLIINNVHHFNNNEEGRDMLLQLQQRAELWAAAGIMTLVFSTDDYWPLHVMRRAASKMHVLSIGDLSNVEALHACGRMRKDLTNRTCGPEEIKNVVSIVGGRLSYLYKVASARDVCEMARNLLTLEKEWLLSQIGLITDCDDSDDVTDEQERSSCSWLLLQEFVKIRIEQEQRVEEKIRAGKTDKNIFDLPLPAISYSRCRQLMTRTDFMEELDRLNIISIDAYHNVRPDSMLILHAAREVVEEGDFERRLNSVRNRINEIESLHRTRELTFKDLDKGDKIRLAVDRR